MHRIIEYADHRGCRHHFILDYFGDAEASERCTVCDNCLSQTSTAIRQPTEEEAVIIQKALSCVARVNGRFGRARIAQTLTGSRSKEVVDARLDQLTTYGLLAEQGADYVWSLLDALIRGGCLEISAGQYPTLSLTELGREVMLRKKTVALAMPAMEAARQPARKRSEKKTATTTSEAPYDEKLFEALRAWRRERAAKMGGVPAYHVFADATLRELARQLPESPADLLNIRGIGPAKAQKFGDDVIELIRAAR